MAQKVGELEAELLLEIAGFVRNAAKAEGSTRKLSAAVGTFGKVAAAGFIAATGALALFSKEAVSLAADAEETLNLLGETFGDATQDVIAFTDDVADSTGRSKFELRELAGEIGAVAVSLTGSRKAGAEFAKELTSLAVDVASFRNLQTEDVVQRFTAALTGEAESLKRLGIVMNQTALQNFALQQGFGDFKKLDEATKAQVRFEFILSKTQDAVGDAARTAGSLTNQQRALTSEFRDFATVVGQELVPLVNSLVGFFLDLSKAFTSDEDAIRDFVRDGVDVAIDAFKFLVSTGFAVQITFQRIKQAGAALATGLLSAFAASIQAALDFERGIADVARALGATGIADALEADAEAGQALVDASRDIAESFLGDFEAAGQAVKELEADELALLSSLEKVKGALRFEAEEAARLEKTIGKGKAEIDKINKALLTLAEQKAFQKLAEEAVEAADAIAEFLDPTVLTISAAEAEVALQGIRDRMLDISNAAPTSGEEIKALSEELENLQEQEKQLATVIKESQEADEARRESMLATAEAISAAFGESLFAFADANRVAKEAFDQAIEAGATLEEAQKESAAAGADAQKAAAKVIISSILDVAEKAIIAAAASSAAQAFFSQAGIPVIGPILAVAAAGAAFAFVSGFLTRFQGGGIVPGFGRGDKVLGLLEPGELVVPNPLVSDFEALLGMSTAGSFQAGGRVAGGAGINVNLTVQTQTFPSRAELDRMIKSNVVPSLRRLRAQGAF